MSFSSNVYMSCCESFSFFSVSRGVEWNLMRKKIKFVLECRPGVVAGTTPSSMKPNLVRILADPPPFWFFPKWWTILGRSRRLHMATLATCSSSLAIRRSWRMTRSLSDLNSRSTSSSLSSIFWSKKGKKVSSTSHLTLLADKYCILSTLKQHFPGKMSRDFTRTETLQQSTFSLAGPLKCDPNTKVCAEP